MNAIKILLGAFVALMVFGGMAMAANTLINANVKQSVEVTAPNSVNIDLVVGQNSIALGEVTVNSNAVNWQLSCSGSGYFNNFEKYNYLSVPTADNKYYGSGSSIPGDGSPVRADNGYLATGAAAGSFNIPVQLSVEVLYSTPIGSTSTTETFTAGLV